MLVRCLYASRMAKPMAPATLRAILEDSRKNNVKNGITGVLISTGDAFIQVLEGGRAQVSQTYNHIASDKRHSEVTLLSFESIPQRSFESWSMGEVTIGQLNPTVLLKHSATMQINPFAMSGAAVLALLNDLVASGTVVCGNATRGKR
ncbi:MAG: BLUF domain-containing protein [Alphaproteobacteria bacterium]|nr:BLUF domain-containing protein [Alphaproteobacteria bacterium]